MTDEEHVPEEEWQKRQLCPDGNCIGVIGPDGRCKECGQPAEGGSVSADADETPSDEPDAAPEAPPAQADEAETPAEPAAADDADDDADDWSRRRLCPDGNCIGVIGPDGRCKECGRPAE